MTTTDTEPRLARRKLTQAQFGAEAIRHFGALPDLWLFRCPLCGHVQAASDLPVERRTHVAQVCFGCGFLAEQAAGPSLERLWLVVLPGGTLTDSFPLADDVDSNVERAPSQPSHGAAQGPGAIPGPGSGDTAPDAAVGAGIGNGAPTVEAPGAYWSVEHGWSDEPKIGCSCHISAPCYSCESLVICTECPGDVAVLGYEMDAHKAEVHPQRGPLPSEPFLTGDDHAETES